MKKVFLLVVSAIALILGVVSYQWFYKKPARETIFDRIVNIPKELVLDIPYLPPLCDEITDLKNGYIDVKDGKLYYEEEGQGIPIVLINGGPGGTHQLFHPYFSQLKDVARVIYYDQRGTGKSTKDETHKAYTLNQAVEDLESLRKVLKIDKWVVLGWSYGGLLAQLYALNYPEHCAGLILGTSDPVGGNEGLYTSEGVHYQRAAQFISPREFNAWARLEKMVQEGKLTPLQLGYNKYLSGFWKFMYYHKPPEEVVFRKLRFGFVQDPDFRKIMISEISKINLAGKFDNFIIPTLIIEGKWDVLWGDMDRVAIMRKNHPHAQLEIFEKSGHMIFADEPQKFFILLKEFFKNRGIS